MKLKMPWSLMILRTVEVNTYLQRMRAEAKVVLVGKKNLKLSHIEQNGEKTVDDQITVDYSLPGSFRSNQSELLQEHRVDETIRSQIRLVGKNGHR